MSETAAQRQRRKELDRIARLGILPLPSPFTMKVVGVSFVPGYPRNMHALSIAWDAQAHREEPLAVVLIRNPKNEADTNAVEVHVPALGNENGRIGFLASPMAARIAPELDAGVAWQGEVVDVLISPQNPDRPGISIRLKRLETDARQQGQAPTNT